MRAEATEYLIFAIGGTGAKVAEALVDMMTVGMPMNRAGRDAQASLHGGDRFTIVRIDTDKECRSSQLDDAIQRYDVLQDHAPKDSGLWGPEIVNGGTLHPLDALGGRDNDESLESYLATRDPDGRGAELLQAFYTPADLATPLHQGFFQCPDIGASVIGSIADHAKAETPSPLIRMMEQFRARNLCVFVVGSLFGGTGAAGVPALARALKTLGQRWNVEERWRLGACLVGPYFLPPDPPTGDIDWGDEWQPGGDETLDAFLARKELSEDQYLDSVVDRLRQEGKPTWDKEVVRQIARGYYAKREEIVDRAFDSWIHYEKHGEHLFDRLYLLGLANPTDYGSVKHKGGSIAWANGGRRQESPLHVIELAAATAAQHFFATEETQQKVFLLGTQPGSGQEGDTLAWDDLGSSRSLDFGRSMTTALVGYNWLRYTWRAHLLSYRDLEKATALEALRKELDESSYPDFYDALLATEQAIAGAIDDLRTALAWDSEHSVVMRHWCEDPETFGERGLIQKRAPVFEFPGGRTLTVSQQDLGCLGTQSEARARQDIGRAALQYLRAVWGELDRRTASAPQIKT